MSKFREIFTKLSSLRKAAEFESVIPVLQNQLAIAEVAADDLRDRLEAALFESPDKIESIRQEITTNTADQESIRAAISGAERRRQEAAHAENMVAVEQRMQEAKKEQIALLADYVEFDQLATAITNRLNTIKEREKTLEDANNFARNHKREELIVRSPWWHLNTRVLGLVGASSENRAEEYPLAGVHIRGYYPPRAGGPALSWMKEVKL